MNKVIEAAIQCAEVVLQTNSAPLDYSQKNHSGAILAHGVAALKAKVEKQNAQLATDRLIAEYIMAFLTNHLPESDERTKCISYCKKIMDSEGADQMVAMLDRYENAIAALGQDKWRHKLPRGEYAEQVLMGHA